MTHFERSTVLAAPIARVAAAIERPETMQFVARGLLRFMPIDPPRLPERWIPGQYRVRLWLFGIVPLGWQVIGLERPDARPPQIVLRDRGFSALIRTWDHQIVIEPAQGGTRYTDRVTIEAGLLTIPVTLFARLLFAYRQRRWHRLVARGFDTSA